MDTLVECVLRTLIQVHPDLFGQNSIFSSFEEDNNDDTFFVGYQSNIRSGRMVYKRDGASRYSDYLLLKQSAQKVVSKYFSPLTLFNEAFFFTRILPYFNTHRSIDHLFPKYYNGLLQYNKDVDGAVIVFEDLRRRGYRHADTRSSLDYDHLKLMMKKLGEFHAYSYRARQQDVSQFFSLARCYHETNSHHHTMPEYPHAMKACVERGCVPLLADPRCASTIEKLGLRNRDVLEVYGEVSKLMLVGDENNPVHVVCHGDFLSNNVLFRYDENGAPVDMKMIDLATWRFASPVFDLATVLYLSADQRTRDEHWDSLIDEYYESLRSTFPATEVPSKESILAEFKKRTLFTYIVVSFFLPVLVCIDNNYPITEDVECTPTEGGEKATIAVTNVFKDMVDQLYGTACTQFGKTLTQTDLDEHNRDCVCRNVLSLWNDFSSKNFNNQRLVPLVEVIAQMPRTYIEHLVAEEELVQMNFERFRRFMKFVYLICMRADSTENPFFWLDSCINVASKCSATDRELFFLYVKDVLRKHRSHLGKWPWLLQLMDLVYKGMNEETMTAEKVSFMCDVFIFAVVIVSRFYPFTKKSMPVNEYKEFFPQALNDIIFKDVSSKVVEWLHFMAKSERISEEYSTVFKNSIIALRYNDYLQKVSVWSKIITVF